jgi:hypothetical protein
MTFSAIAGIDPTLGADAVRAHVALRRADAELVRYVNADPQPPVRELAAGICERLASIKAARADVVMARGTLGQADDRAKAYRAELDKLEARHARAVARLNARYGKRAG